MSAQRVFTVTQDGGFFYGYAGTSEEGAFITDCTSALDVLKVLVKWEEAQIRLAQALSSPVCQFCEEKASHIIRADDGRILRHLCAAHVATLPAVTRDMAERI